MNLLSLISSWLDIICQVTTKCATVPKLTTFHQLNRANNQRHDMKKNVSVNLFSLTTSEESNVICFLETKQAVPLPFYWGGAVPLLSRKHRAILTFFFLFCLSLSREYLNICAASSSSLFFLFVWERPIQQLRQQSPPKAIRGPQ